MANVISRLRLGAWTVGSLAVFAGADACSPTRPTPTTTSVVASSTSAPATTTALLVLPTATRYQGQTTAGPLGGGPQTVTIDLTLYFNLPRSGSGGERSPRAVDYEVTGGYQMSNGVTGAVEGTLEGTPLNGVFTGTLTADLVDCTARRAYSGPLTASALDWTAGAELENCGGRSPLGGPLSVPASSNPPSTTTVANSTTSTVAQSSTTSTVGPTSSTTSIASSTTSTSTSSSTSSSITTTVTSTTTSAIGSAKLSVNPTTGSHATNFAFTGTGFPPSCGIVFTFSGPGGAGNGALTDAAGHVALDMPGSLFLGGTYDVVAKHDPSAITKCPPFTESNQVTIVVDDLPPQIAVTPSTGKQSTTFTVTGSGLRASCNFTIRMSLVGGSHVVTVRAGSDRPGNLSQTLPPGTTLGLFVGTYDVVVVSDNGGGACYPFPDSNHVTVFVQPS